MAWVCVFRVPGEIEATEIYILDKVGFVNRGIEFYGHTACHRIGGRGR